MIINENIAGKKLPTLSNPAAAGDLLENKQLIDANGNILTGTMPSVEHPAPTISVGSNGLITAKHTQSAGKVGSGTTQKTYQLTTQGGKTVTPGTSQQTAVASGRYTTGNIYVAGSSNLKASNIKSGVNIFGITGTYEGENSGGVLKKAYGTGGHSISFTGVNFTPTYAIIFVANGDGDPDYMSGSWGSYKIFYAYHTPNGEGDFCVTSGGYSKGYQCDVSRSGSTVTLTCGNIFDSDVNYTGFFA